MTRSCSVTDSDSQPGMSMQVLLDVDLSSRRRNRILVADGGRVDSHHLPSGVFGSIDEAE